MGTKDRLNQIRDGKSEESQQESCCCCENEPCCEPGCCDFARTRKAAGPVRSEMLIDWL